VTNSGWSASFAQTGMGPVNVTVTYSDVWNNFLNYGELRPRVGAISSNPSYISPTNFHLTAGSVGDRQRKRRSRRCRRTTSTRQRAPPRRRRHRGVGYDMGAYELSSRSQSWVGARSSRGPQPF
jgi:hypothetical protein